MTDKVLWEYSGELYRREHVESVLLLLQDEFGADINLVLTCCWLAAREERVSAELIKALLSNTAKWQTECIMPLRSVRRFLKNDESKEAFRERVKDLELEAECWQQEHIQQQLKRENIEQSDLPLMDLMRENINIYCALLPGVEHGETGSLIAELLLAIERDAT